MARLTRALAEELCGGRLVLILEGGYAPSGLEEGTRAVLDALLEPNPAPPPVSLIVRKNDQNQWLDDTGADWTLGVSGPQAR